VGDRWAILPATLFRTEPHVHRLPIAGALTACLASLLLLGSCDDAESTLGGSPGGNPIAVTDSSQVETLVAFHLPQSLVGAARHLVGRSDSLGLESALLFRLNYTPFTEWSDPPEGVPTVQLSFKMDNLEALAWFPQLADAPHGVGESARYLDLELLLLQDSLDYDGLGWADLFSDTLLQRPVLDRLSFRVSSADTAFGDSNDPLTGRRTYREVPSWWFQHADTTARWLLLRPLSGQQGFVPLLGSGYTTLLRPGIRVSTIQVDSVLVNNVAVADTSWDTTYVAAAWQTSLVRDAAPARSLSSGWAGQLFTRLPAFPPDPDDPAYDPLVSTLSEAWLELPLDEVGFNRAGAKVNLYAVRPQDSLGVDVEADQLVSSAFTADTTEVLRFNLTSYLRRVWVEDDTLRNTDPIPLVVKLDDYYLLQVRQLRLADPALRPPRLHYSLSQAPAGWRQP
jgi:hypothetical protein